MCGWFQGGGRQGAVEIRLVEPDDPKAGRGRVVAQPGKGQLVGHRQ
jgi:hypothetical protein